MLHAIEKILEITLVESKYLTISLVDIFKIIGILVLFRIFVWLFARFMKKRVANGTIDEGKAFAIRQILSYFIYIVAIIIVLNSLGVELTLLLAGSTALFVGLGLGLQDTFKDFVAGVIILIERTITVGDVVEIDLMVGKVREVGLRTTTILTRDDIEMIIPNKRLTNERVINWSRSGKITRFDLKIGVAYGSDLQLVKKLLLEVAANHNDIAKTPEPSFFFADFGSSSLDVKLLFFSQNLFRIERVKSDLRFEIDRVFRLNNISIPFPQRDLWLREEVKHNDIQ